LGMTHVLATLSGFHAVFITFFAIEVIGLLIALMLKNTHKKVAN